jgi:phospholipase C
MPTGPIEHLIVLMLENRSFDHMLGFLNHPNDQYPRLQGIESNPWQPGSPPVAVSDDALLTLPLDPSHSHADVLIQITGMPSPQLPYVPLNNGFVYNYEWVGLHEKKQYGFGPLIMKCQPEQNVKILAALAKAFAVCTRWFASVPGQTWPNRNFAHAATSDGEVNIRKRLYTNPTIFELLANNNKQSVIYHDSLCQVAVFKNLLFKKRVSFAPTEQLYDAIRSDKLPQYSFVEPDHFGSDSGSQHPGNNTKHGRDFLRAEQLIADIYTALRSKPDVFAKTLFLITYDEHGGFFDHVPPPYSETYKDGKIAAEGKFAFDLLGVRVPAVLVSPRIPPGTVDDTIYDHSSIVGTLRKLFVPDAAPLTSRDANGNTFEHIVNESLLREQSELPDVAGLLQPQMAAGLPGETPELDRIDEFQDSLIWLREKLEAELVEAGTPIEMMVDGPTAAAEFGDGNNPVSGIPEAQRQRRVAAAIHALTARQ